MEKIVITDHEHLREIWTAMGLKEAHILIQRLLKQYQLPGLALAESTLAARAEAQRAEMIVANITLALDKGFDVKTQNLIMKNDKVSTWLEAESLDKDAGKAS